MQVETIATSTQKPSNVAVYVSVKNGDEALYGLSPENFAVHENDQPLDSKQVGLTLLSRDVAAVHHAVVLVDLSGTGQDDGALALLANQLAPFLERLRDKFSISVYGFDGSDQLAPLGGFGKIVDESASTPVSKQDLTSVSQYVQKDSSSNLNGAVIAALKKLDVELGLSPKPIALGTLVIIARGPDLASRTKADALTQALDDTEHQVFAATVGSTEDTQLAETLGPAGYSQTSLFENLENSLAEVASMLERDHSRYYLLSYCSPSRSGERTLTVQVKKTEGDGSELTGDTELTFNATGFQSGCDASTVPLFQKGVVAAQPAAMESAADPADGGLWFGQGRNGAATRAAPSPSTADSQPDATTQAPAAEPASGPAESDTASPTPPPPAGGNTAQ
jgi:hypothetical protein